MSAFDPKQTLGAFERVYVLKFAKLDRRTCKAA
jgi:hypothetical protein